MVLSGRRIGCVIVLGCGAIGERQRGIEHFVPVRLGSLAVIGDIDPLAGLFVLLRRAAQGERST